MSWRLQAGARIRSVWAWLVEAVGRLGYFALSLLCGVCIPLSTLGAERALTGAIGDVSWFSAAVTYVAGIGLVSKKNQVLLLMLIVSAALAFLYGVDMEDEVHKQARRFSSEFARYGVGVAALLYAIERVGLHLIDNRSFPE